jgi:methyl-accepting chemotaxis protein WspA
MPKETILNNLSVRKKLFLGFFAIVAIIVCLLLVAYNNFTRLGQANALDNHTLQVLLAGDQLEQAADHIQGIYLTFLADGKEESLRDLDGQQAELQRWLKEARTLTADNPNQQARLSQIESEAQDWITSRVLPRIEKRRDFNKKAITADQLLHDVIMTGGFSRVQILHKTLDAFEAEEKRLLVERSHASAELRQSMTLVLIMGGLLCVVLAALISIFLSRAILTPLGNLTRTVAAIAGGDQSARATVLGKDELGRVTEEFNRMAQAVQSNQQRELDATNALKSKVDALLASVSRGATGDLTGKVTVSGTDAIGQLGEGLSTMFDNLRGLLMKVQRAGIQVTTSTTEIAASARQQEATGVEQAQTSVEVLSTTKEISANTKQLLKTMDEATQVAEFTTTATVQAQVNMKRMDDTMQNMVNATDSINAKLAALSEKASNINNVLVTITKVADQTNILSLNAAIEAEKAGDAGRGFAVVATEIRRLADQTSVATWDIEQMLKEMQSAVSASVMGMDKFSDEIRRSVGEVRQVSEQLSSVILQVQQLPPRFDAVLEGMQSQSIGASQITETMMQLSEASQQTVESLKATSDAVNQLQHAARDLQASVANFSVND